MTASACGPATSAFDDVIRDRLRTTVYYAFQDWHVIPYPIQVECPGWTSWSRAPIRRPPDARSRPCRFATLPSDERRAWRGRARVSLRGGGNDCAEGDAELDARRGSR